MGSKTSGRHVCIALYDVHDMIVGVFENTAELSKYLGLTLDSTRCGISRCNSGKQKYIWDKQGHCYVPYKLKEN